MRERLQEEIEALIYKPEALCRSWLFHLFEARDPKMCIVPNAHCHCGIQRLVWVVLAEFQTCPNW